MNLFQSGISESLYGAKVISAEKICLKPPKNKPSLKSFFDRGILSLEKFKGLEEMFEGFVIPDRYLGTDSEIIPSPLSHRTYKSEIGGRIEVWGNSIKIDSNIQPNVMKEGALWYKEVDEYGFFDGKVRRKKTKKYATPTRKEGDIKNLSKDSRRRLIKKVNKVNYKNRTMPLWITLTYPERFPTESEEYKADLDTFIKRLKRKFVEIEYLWRLEFQKRGAPHYHIILFLPLWKGNIAYLRKWVSKNWYEVAQRFWNRKDEKHLKAGTNCKHIKNYRQLISYVSKYMGKLKDTSDVQPGRLWAASSNWGDHIGSIVISGNGLVQFIRIIRRYIKSQGSYKMAKYIAKNPNTEVFLPSSVVVHALEWIEELTS